MEVLLYWLFAIVASVAIYRGGRSIWNEHQRIRSGEYIQDLKREDETYNEWQERIKR